MRKTITKEIQIASLLLVAASDLHDYLYEKYGEEEFAELHADKNSHETHLDISAYIDIESAIDSIQEIL